MKYTRDTAKHFTLETCKDFFVCPLTPVTPDLKFDEAGIRKNIEAYIDMKVDGLVVGGFLAEGWNSKLSDWMEHHRIVADAVKGRIPLWSIVLDPSVHQALEKIEELAKLGYDGAEVINPVVQLRSDDEIFDWFKYLTDNTDMAICLYRTQISGVVMNWNLMQRLADIPTITSVKNGVMNRTELIKLRQLLRKDFLVSDPFEYYFLEDLRIGGEMIWGDPSYILFGKKRHLARDYVNLGRAGRWEEARVKWEQLNPIRDYYNDLFAWNLLRTGAYAGALAELKAWCEVIGLQGGPMLPPLKQLSPARKEEIAAKLKQLGVV